MKMYVVVHKGYPPLILHREKETAEMFAKRFSTEGDYPEYKIVEVEIDTSFDENKNETI